MKCLIQDALVGSKIVDSYTDKKTGEVREYYKIGLNQNNSESMDFSVDYELFNRLNRGSIYDLMLDISTFAGKRRFKVVDAFQPGDLDIA